MAKKYMDISEIVQFLKSNPIFSQFQAYVAAELEREREQYENSEANEFLRGRVSILKKLKADLEK